MFKLFMFKDGVGKYHITRGENKEDALFYLENICHEKGLEFVELNFPHAAFVYSKNHPFDWLNNAPIWKGNRKFVPHDFEFKNRFRNSAQLSVKSV